MHSIKCPNRGYQAVMDAIRKGGGSSFWDATCPALFAIVREKSDRIGRDSKLLQIIAKIARHIY